MQKLYEEGNIQAIADAIRAKNGTNAKYKTSEMASAISAIEAGGDLGDFKTLLEVNYDEITELTIPEGITKLRNYCFQYYDALESVSLPSTLVALGSSSFSGCYALSQITLPENLTNIYPRVFEDCSSLTSVTIPSGVKTLFECTFGWCYGLTEVTFKGTPESISEELFWKCNNLTTINVPWAEGAVANAPWGATNATINYNYVG